MPDSYVACDETSGGVAGGSTASVGAGKRRSLRCAQASHLCAVFGDPAPTASALTSCVMPQTQLTSLDLSGNDLGDDGAAILSDELLGRCAQLQRLQMRNAQLGPTGAALIAQVHYAPTPLYAMSGANATRNVRCQSLSACSTLSRLDLSSNALQGTPPDQMRCAAWAVPFVPGMRRYCFDFAASHPRYRPTRELWRMALPAPYAMSCTDVPYGATRRGARGSARAARIPLRYPRQNQRLFKNSAVPAHSACRNAFYRF